MARRKSHKDVEFHIDRGRPSRNTRVFRNFDEAMGVAASLSLSTGQPVKVDVVVWSEAGARWLEGDEGVEKYRFDPETSVFERIVIKATSQGRIP